MIIGVPPDSTVELEETKLDRDKVEEYLNVPNWKCECRLVNFGRNKRCADPKCRKEPK